MGRFDDNRSGGRRFDGFKRRPFNDEPREMHKAVCSECKKECEVPFKPSNDAEGKPRPVFCKECFMKRNPRRF
jgi:CxxC-x17-CxxC domain-containing protein